jgi:hypothetical protein
MATRMAVHMASEAVAILAIAPFLFHVATTVKMPPLYSNLLIAIAVATIVIDGWLLYMWLNHETTPAVQPKDHQRIKTLVRQAARWASAARQDKNIMISVLHANYGAGYLWSLIDIYDARQVATVLPDLDISKFKAQIVAVQDWATKRLARACPEYAPEETYLTKVAGKT